MAKRKPKSTTTEDTVEDTKTTKTVRRTRRAKAPVKTPKEEATITPDVDLSEVADASEAIDNEPDAPEATNEQPDIPVATNEQPDAPEVPNNEAEKTTKPYKLEGSDFKTVIDSAKKNPSLLHLVAAFNRYVDKVFNNPVNNSEMASMNYDLFRTILSVINSDDYNEFKTKFDFINRIFLVEKKHMFSPVVLNRNDLYWTHGSTNRFNYAILTEFISNMSHPGERAKYASKINADTVTSFLSDKGSFNLTKYYKL